MSDISLTVKLVKIYVLKSETAKNDGYDSEMGYVFILFHNTGYRYRFILYFLRHKIKVWFCIHLK